MCDWDDYDEDKLLELEGLGQFLLNEKDDGTYELELVNAYMKNHDGPYPDFVIKHVVIPSEYEGKTITSLSAYDFNGEDPGGADEVLSITVPDTVRDISNLFEEFTAIENVTLPDSVERLIGCTFRYCYDLKHVTLSRNITEMGGYVFEWCGCLEEITLPEGLKKIGNGCFEYCRSLKEFRIPKSLTEIGNRCFDYTEHLARFEVDEENPAFRAIDGDLYTKDGKTLIKYAQGKEQEVFEVPEGVETIAVCALNARDSLDGENEHLRAIVLASTVETIEELDIWGEFYEEPRVNDAYPDYIEIGNIHGLPMLMKM